MSHASQMGPRPGGEPTGPEGLGKIRLPTEEEVEKGLLDTIVDPKNASSIQELQAIKLIQEIQDKSLEILQTKADLLAELKEIIDHETLLQRLDSYFTEMTKVINNLVSEIEKNKQIPQMLGVEAVEELIEDIKNSLCLDPKKDGDLIDKLQSLPETYLEDNIARFQLALILDGGNKLKKFKRHVQAALIHNDDKKLKGLVQEISALEIMQLSPSLSSSFISEREAWKLIIQYDKLKYQAILTLEGGNTLEQFKERVQAALNNYEELEGLVQEISALEIMQVYPSSYSPFIPEEIEAYELQVEYQRMIEMIKEAQKELRKLGPST